MVPNGCRIFTGIFISLHDLLHNRNTELEIILGNESLFLHIDSGGEKINSLHPVSSLTHCKLKRSRFKIELFSYTKKHPIVLLYTNHLCTQGSDLQLFLNSETETDHLTRTGYSYSPIKRQSNTL